MRVSAPRFITFLFSIIIFVVGVLVARGMISGVPIESLWIMVAGYALLALGCLFKNV